MAALGNQAFDLFKLPDEHNELRAVLRDICETEIAHPRLPGRTHDARREDHPDLRRYQPDSARRHGTRSTGMKLFQVPIKEMSSMSRADIPNPDGIAVVPHDRPAPAALGGGGLPALEPAPGTYVHER